MDVSYEEIALEITADEKFNNHKFIYYPIDNVLHYNGMYSIYKSVCEYSNMTAKDYEKWFKDNRYQRKAIPIFTFHDSRCSFAAKKMWCLTRSKIIDLLVHNRRLFASIKKLISKIYG